MKKFIIICAECKKEINSEKSVFVNIDGKILCCSMCAKIYTTKKNK